MSSTRESAEAGRTWRGRSAEARRSERRAQLIEAGIELFGTEGYVNSSVKAVCSKAGLTERYFYESFSDRHDLLVEIYAELVETAALAVGEAMAGAPETVAAQTRAGLSAFALTVTSDPRRARIQQLEVVGVSDELERHRRAALHRFASLIAETGRRFGADGKAAGLDPDVIAIGLVGAVNEQLVDFVLGEIELDLESLIDHQVSLFAAAVGVLSGAQDPAGADDSG